MNKLYLIGSLRNDRIPKLASRLRAEHPSIEVFDDWYSAGPEADDYWKEYEKSKESTYSEALAGYAAQHVFAFDKSHLDACSHAILVLPAGKSGHLEIAYAQYGSPSKPKTAILLDPAEDPRFDVMYNFIPNILESDEQIGEFLAVETPAKGYTVVGPNELVARGRQTTKRVSAGGWTAGLFPERTSGNRPTL